MTARASRQREYQKRHAAEGLCMYCPLPVYGGMKYCETHREYDLNRRAAKRGGNRWTPGGKGRPPKSQQRAGAAEPRPS